MHGTVPEQLARSPTTASLAPRVNGMVAAPEHRGVGRQRGGGQPVDESRPGGGPAALRNRQLPGARCRLTAAPLARVPTLLNAVPKPMASGGNCGPVAEWRPVFDWHVASRIIRVTSADRKS